MAYSDKTPAAIIAEVRSLINEPTARFVSDSDITAWIDYATNRIARVTLFDEKIATETVTANTEVYPLSATTPAVTTDELKVVAVIYAPTGATNGTGAYALTRTHPRQFGKNRDATAGPAKEYSVMNDAIRVWPRSSGAAEDGDILIIYYIDYTATYGAYNLPPYLQEYTILYAIAKAFEKMGKYSVSEQYNSIFESFLMFHRMDRFHQPVDSKDMLQTQDNARVIQ